MGNRKPERDKPLISAGVATLVSIMMIVMSIAWPEMWGPVGGWTWFGMFALLITVVANCWRRALSKYRAPSLAAPPAPNSDAPAELK
jgi:hypothetical protein